jgi:hypothetical protein
MSIDSCLVSYKNYLMETLKEEGRWGDLDRHRWEDNIKIEY